VKIAATERSRLGPKSFASERTASSLQMRDRSSTSALSSSSYDLLTAGP
jgi:hypothetical protein